MSDHLAEDTQSAIPVHAVAKGGDYPAELSAEQRDWLKATGFSGAIGEVALLPDSGRIAAVLVGWGTDATEGLARHPMRTRPQGRACRVDGDLVDP